MIDMQWFANAATALGFPALIYTLYKAHRASIVTNTIWLIDYVQNEYNRTARHRVRHLIRGKSFGEMTPEEIHACEVVIATYDVAGCLARSKLIDEKTFFSAWSPSIIDAYKNTLQVLTAARDRMGSSHSEGFVYAYKTAERYTRAQTHAAD